MSIGIRVTVTEVNRVLGTLELILEGEGEVNVFEVGVKLNPVLVVPYVSPCPDPSDLVVAKSRLTVCQYPGTMVKQSTRLLVVQNVEFEQTGLLIFDSEVEPVVVSFGIDVVAQQQVVFVIDSLADYV